MRKQKDTQRSTVKIGFDGKVYKTFRGPQARERFETEVRVLRYLEEKGCDFVPRLLSSEPDALKIVTSNCGAIVEQMGDDKLRGLFEELEGFGVRHDDPYLRNVTYRPKDGRFCVIDFEFATILEDVPVDGGGDETGGAEAKPAGPAVEWSCATDVGRYRKNNEDAFLALALDEEGAHYLGAEGAAGLGRSDFLFAVSDGMGGARSGEFASRIAVEKITQLLPRHFRRTGGGQSGSAEALTDLFRLIHLEMGLLGEAYPECSGMGATLSLCWFTPRRVLVAHIGDSRVYRWREGGGISQITHDDTQVGALQRSGKISDYEARNHPGRNRLMRALGGRNQYVDPQLEELPVGAGERFLICSDGVTEGVWDRALGRHLEARSEAGDLVAEAVRANGRDNATAVVVSVV